MQLVKMQLHHKDAAAKVQSHRKHPFAKNYSPIARMQLVKMQLLHKDAAAKECSHITRM